MRAMTITTFGGPEVLRLQEMPMPVPREHDLLIQVSHAAINPVDFKIRRGAFREGRQLPFIPGYDVSGTVRGLGTAASGFKVGDEVYASPSLIRDGADAEFVCVDARTVAPKPAGCTHAEAAALPLVTLTAWEALHHRCRVKPGELVLIHAGGGGVGHVAIQLARHHGCRVLATASRDASIELCKKLGAEVINYANEDFVARVKKETGGNGCPVVFDTVGGETFDRSLDCVAVDGRIVTCVGSHSEKIPTKLFRINATLYFEFMGTPTVYGVRPESQGEILRAAAKFVDDGHLRPHISRVIPLDKVPDAHRELETAHVTGKIVVRV